MSLVFAPRGPALAAALGCHGNRCRSAPAAALWPLPRLLPLCRYLSTAETERQKQQQQQKSVIFSDRQANQSYANLTPAQKVVERTKDAGYGLVVLAGALVTGGLFYALWRELFSSGSASALQALALERCLANPQVQAALGEPIKSHGEGVSRRSRSRVMSEESVDADGVKLVSLKFYLVGQFNRADVYAQGYMTAEKTWRLKLLAVEVQRYPKRVILLEREEETAPAALVPITGQT